MSSCAALSGKPCLSISEAALFLGVSRPTIYKRIESGDIHPIRYSARTVRIPMDELTASLPQPEKEAVDYSRLITLEAAMAKYKASKTDIYRKLAKRGVKSRRIGFVTYLPADTLDDIFGQEGALDESVWVAAEVLAEKHGLSRKYVNDFALKHGISRKKAGSKLYVSVAEWNEVRFSHGEDGDYMSGKEAKAFYHVGGERFYEAVNAAGVRKYRNGRDVLYCRKDLDRLFKDKGPDIPAEIRRVYMLGREALKFYHIGQKRFLAETKAASVRKVKTEGNFVWYLKSDLDKLFKKI